MEIGGFGGLLGVGPGARERVDAPYVDHVPGQVGHQDVDRGEGHGHGGQQRAGRFGAKGPQPHRCLGPFGIDAVHLDAHRRPFVGERLGQVDNRGLGRGVQAVPGPAARVGTRRVQQQVAPGGGQVADRRLGDRDRRQVVHPDGLLDRGGIGVGELARVQHARGVDHEVDPAGGLVRLPERGPDLAGAFDVGAGLRPAEREDLGAELPGDRADVGADPVASPEHDQGLAGQPAPLLVRRRRGRRLAGGELEQLVGDVHVDRVGHLHVVLAARHDVDRGAGQVAEHHPAVVGGGTGNEARVAAGELVGAPDHRQPEPLRRLAAAQPFPRRDRADQAGLVDGDDGVGGGYRDVHRRVHGQGGDAVGDDPRVDQRADGIVEQHQAVRPRPAGAEHVDGRAGGVGALGAALEHPPDLAVPALADQPLGLAGVADGHHDEDLVNVRVRLEGVQGVFEDRLAGDLEQLLRDVQPDPGAGSAREDHGHRPQPCRRRRHDAIASPATRHRAWPAPPSTWRIYSYLASRLLIIFKFATVSSD
jgi:hypothetical protein